MTKWLTDVADYVGKHYPEGTAYVVNYNIDFYDEATPVSCRQIRGTLERLDKINEEMRLLAGGITATLRR